MNDLTHLDEKGRPRMVDVTNKPVTARRAVARGQVVFSEEAYNQIKDGTTKKGDIARIAELAGIGGVKQTSSLIPLCHPLPISGVEISVDTDDACHGFCVTASVTTDGKTGVEMEALTGVSIACLTIYDMAKAIDKSITIEKIELVEKSGGKSGDFRRE